MTQVVFFDYWTEGIHNFLPIAEKLRGEGIDSKLVHLGSWYDPQIAIEETIKGLPCSDIRYYGGSIQNVIERESPRVLVALNTTLPMDRVVNRICRTTGVKTVYLMHGILPVGHNIEEATRRINKYLSVARRLRKLPKYARIISLYMKALLKDSFYEFADLSNYLHFLQGLLSPGNVLFRPWPHKDIYSDRALVYAEVYRELFINEVGYPPERVVVVGNPNLDPAFDLLRDNNAYSQSYSLLQQIGVPQGRLAVVYMEEAWAALGFAGWNEATLLEEVRQIASAVQCAGMDLIVKMHPSCSPDPLRRAFSDERHVHIISEANLPRLVFGCVATLGRMSTTLMLPVVLHRPLIVPLWSPGSGQFEYYVKQGVGIPASTPENLTRVLMQLEEEYAKNLNLREVFIRRFITYTDGLSWERITHEIMEFIQ
jgi:hypothetical protein